MAARPGRVVQELAVDAPIRGPTISHLDRVFAPLPHAASDALHDAMGEPA